VAVTAGGLEMPYGIQQSLIILLAQHQDDTKTGWRVVSLRQHTNI